MLSSLTESLDKCLPQYQCGRCGQPDCAHYAKVLAARQETPDRCAPGGLALAQRLAAAVDVPLSPTAVYDEDVLQCARVVEEACIGCARCLRACPLDALIGAPKRLHAVLPMLCSGCGLCLPVCPTDCIVLEPAGKEWTGNDAAAARDRYRARLKRLAAAKVGARHRAGAISAGVAAMPEEPAKAIEVAAETRQRAIREALAAARARRKQHHAQQQARRGADEK